MTTSGGAKEMTQYESHSRDDKGVSFYALQWPMGLRNDLHMPQGYRLEQPRILQTFSK